ncbi:MFS transporter [Bacillus sp. 1P06AnD]|uniref:MFS transporter n=1 Tax=Bacillus sp. 1P06AnD TaxID=3132208 RepID=UPI0039A0EAAA
MKRVNPAEIINTSRFNRFHYMLLAWCFFIIIFDGYDLVVYGTVVPKLIEEWHLTSVEAGALSSYGLFGMMFGAIFLGMLADKIGRKKVIAVSLFLFSLFTFLCGFTDSPTTFSAFRFIAGLGLGGIMPNVIALMTDYAPQNRKSMAVSIVLCGYSVGGMLAPFLGIVLMPTFGWESIFWFAGLPLVLIPLIYKKLPESSSHLLRNGKKQELIAILSRVNPDRKLSPDVEWTEAAEEVKIPVAGLFKETRTRSTIMFWIAFFMCLLMVFGLNTWLPKLMINAGYGLNSSLAFLISLQAGAIAGTLIVAWLCDRYGSKKMLVPLYALGAVSLILLGFGGSPIYIYVLVTIAGACTTGAQNLVQAYVSQYYPPNVCSTALGMASGIGRVGGIIGPLMGGFLLAQHLPIHMNFIAFAIPGVIASVALSLVPEKLAYYRQRQLKEMPKPEQAYVVEEPTV